MNIVSASAMAPIFGVCLCILGTGVVADDVMPSELLLAEERNLVPARVMWYQLKISSLEPVEESEVLEWTDVEPGIWFPRRATLVKYDPLAMKRKGIKQISWTDEISTSDLSLKPQKDQSFFRE